MDEDGIVGLGIFILVVIIIILYTPLVVLQWLGYSLLAIWVAQIAWFVWYCRKAMREEE